MIVEKILIIGPEFFGYNESVEKSYKELGYETKIFNYYDGYEGKKNEIICKEFSKIGFTYFKDKYDEKLNREILQVYYEYNPEVVLFIKGNQIHKNTLLKMKDSKKILWMMDSIYTVPESVENVELYDYRFMFEATDVEKLREKGIESYFLPLAVDPHNYYEIHNVEKDIDLLFIGQLYDNRKELFEKLIKDFKNLNIVIYGKYTKLRKPYTFIKYYTKNRSKYFTNKFISVDKVNGLYARSKICLNLHHKQSKQGCNPRFFEITSSGAFQIVDDIPYIKENYGDVSVTFSNYEELKKQIDLYLKDEYKRIESINKSKAKILEGNLFIDRVRDIINITR